ncbi:MAG: response regulator [Syntrophales bacterium]|jgi:two-component system alkaline phosphatase synthesis response regulator PhoP|nr:response regulator [Syntrophales bacterium]MDD4340415.1 response regulator [Syntrophales bacterium]HOG07266.1 response regulator [Syntrophales bacterium]
MHIFRKLVPVTDKTILIVDDEEDFCHLVKLNLEATNHYKVLTAYNGRDGIDMAIQHQPDLILLDIIMPKMSGTEVADVLRNHESTKGIPIIFVTAIFTRSQVGASEYQIGENYFLFKPITFNQLLREIGAKLG